MGAAGRVEEEVLHVYDYEGGLLRGEEEAGVWGALGEGDAKRGWGGFVVGEVVGFGGAVVDPLRAWRAEGELIWSHGVVV